MPSTFASAAASQSDDSARRASGRADSADWSRRPNGATQTFRRPSFATAAGSISQRDTTMNPATSSGTYQPPHSSSRNGIVGSTRYSRDQLLGLYREQRDGGELGNGLKDLFIGDFDPEQRDSTSMDATSRPEVCLNHTADTEPLGLVEMSEEEFEHYTTSVNSPLKAPNQGNQRDGTQREGSGLRKSSMSHAQSSATVSTPLSARIPNRRDTSESHPWPRDSMSPAVSRSGREEQGFEAPISLTRRNTESKDGETGRNVDDRGQETRGHNSRSSFGPLRRVSTGPMSAGVGGPQSPWSQPSGNAFGAFGFPNSATDSSTRPGGLARGESRFKGLMNRDSLNEDEHTLQERPSHASLERLSEADLDQGRSAFKETREETREQRPVLNEQRRTSRPSFLGHAKISGFAGSDLHPWEELHQQDDSQRGTMQVDDEPQSPTYTNPYQSPKRPTANPQEMNNTQADFESFHLPGLGGSLRDDITGAPTSSAPSFARTTSGYDSRAFERGPPTSGGPIRGFAGLGGLGGLPPVGHPGNRAAAYSSGTPSRERMLEGFGDPNSRGEGLQGFGSVALPPNLNQNERAPAAGRTGRLGSLFPSGMQDQMKVDEVERQRHAPTEDYEGASEPFEAFGSRMSGQNLGPGAKAARSGESPPRFARAHYEDLDPSDAHTNLRDLYSSEKPSHLAQANAQSQSLLEQNQQHQSSGMGNSTGQPPAAQQKTMVMPDRIRWIYRDPQGNTQGPWSGLEMHDWYRAGFFSPELLVKKAEDADYEPLAQLIRRIGNSREPFLVPQIGIPGPPSTANASAWTPQAPAPATAPSTAPAAQPPFASSFPSFGTTLTAEQQNALERRKQEEQYLMARQKEHLAQQQVLVKQMQLQSPHGAHQQPLQHHSSAHSLQSQPSYGSITSPNAYQTGHLTGPGSAQQSHGGFDNTARQGPGNHGSGMESLRDIEEEALCHDFGQFGMRGNNARHRAEQHQYSGQMSDNDRIQAMLNDRARLQEEQERYDASKLNEEMEQERQSGRVQQFYDLQQTLNDDQKRQASLEHDSTRLPHESMTFPSQSSKPSQIGKAEKHPKPQSLTLTEQVQQAAYSKDSPAIATHSPWARIDKPITESHPISQTSSPLPAPAARRSGGQSVADALAAGSSPSHASPSTESTAVSVAPWAAKESAEAPKQVSLKQIQEAESRRAAKLEEAQAAMRRAALEKEITAQPVAPAPGLPSSSTWASGDALPSPSVSGPSAWAKAAPVKPTSISGPSKKTLQQIQKEEEAAEKRKKALAAAAIANTSGVKSAAATAMPAGKRYADLAGGGATQAPPGIAASAWTTVGASGKPKTPGTPTFPATVGRVASVDNSSNAPTAPKIKPVVAALRTNVSSTGFNAQDDFKRWAVGELRPDLKKGIQVDDFVSSLHNLPLETDLITEAVYASSSTLDSRHFAEEYVRRRALADKGKAQPPSGGASAAPNSSAAESKGSGGWSEVARKGPVTAGKDESSAFKVVPSKKKGKR